MNEYVDRIYILPINLYNGYKLALVNLCYEYFLLLFLQSQQGERKLHLFFSSKPSS